MSRKMQKAKKLINELNKLDVQYLLNHPKKMARKTYLKRRNALRKRFRVLKKSI